MRLTRPSQHRHLECSVGRLAPFGYVPLISRSGNAQAIGGGPHGRPRQSRIMRKAPGGRISTRIRMRPPQRPPIFIPGNISRKGFTYQIRYGSTRIVKPLSFCSKTSITLPKTDIVVFAGGCLHASDLMLVELLPIEATKNVIFPAGPLLK